MTRSQFGSVQYLSEGRYRVYWRECGKQRTKTIRGTRDDAEVYLAARRIERGESPEMKMTVRAYYEGIYHPSLHVAPGTLNTYEREWRLYVEPLFGDDVMETMTAKYIERRIWELETPSAQRHCFTLLRQIFNDAYASEVIRDNPMTRRIKLKKKAPKEKAVYTLSDVPAVLDAIYGERVEPYILCSLFGGLRREESLALYADYITFNVVDSIGGGKSYTAYVDVHETVQMINGELVVGPCKTFTSKRVVPIAGYPAERLYELLNGLGHVPLSAGVRQGGGQLLSPDTWAWYWRELCKEKGLRHVPFKDLRASFATIQSELGTNIATTSKMMGHTIMQTNYAYYQRPQMEAYEEAAKTIGRSIERPA